MPDTDELQQHFGQPGGQLPGCGFPVAHLMALLTLKGVFGVFRIHQKIKVEFPTPEDPASEGATACKGRLPRWLHRLGAMDQLVEWIKPKRAPNWMTAEE